jgi:hypothetical protein
VEFFRPFVKCDAIPRRHRHRILIETAIRIADVEKLRDDLRDRAMRRPP